MIATVFLVTYTDMGGLTDLHAVCSTAAAAAAVIAAKDYDPEGWEIQQWVVDGDEIPRPRFV